MSKYGNVPQPAPENLFDLYVTARMSQVEIAGIHKVSETQVRHWLIRECIPIRKKRKKPRRRQYRMRFYQNFPEALNEIRREIKEMGVVVHNKSVQNMDISEDSDYVFMELQDYVYLVTKPDYTTIPLKNPVWCEEEFKERISGQPINPGHAWKLRKEYWHRFLNKFGQFDYSYPERMSCNLERVIRALKLDLYTRRAFLPILGLGDAADEFTRRFPCSIGYHFMYRQNRLNMTYYLRSSDFFEHLNNDLWLANRLQHHVAEAVGVESGTFCHHVGSLHAFSKDLKGVF
jgi:thymidylate synthase